MDDSVLLGFLEGFFPINNISVEARQGRETQYKNVL